MAITNHFVFRICIYECATMHTVKSSKLQEWNIVIISDRNVNELLTIKHTQSYHTIYTCTSEKMYRMWPRLLSIILSINMWYGANTGCTNYVCHQFMCACQRYSALGRKTQFSRKSITIGIQCKLNLDL